MRSWAIRVIAGFSLMVAAVACGRGGNPTGAPVTEPASGSNRSPTATPTPTSSPSIPVQTKVGTWQLLPPAPIAAPITPASVWTGTEMLVFGRVRSAAPGGDYDVAAAYNPATDTWRELPVGPGRQGNFEGAYRAVWTGSEMLVWGITNKAFNPATNRWRLLPDPPLNWGAPAVAVWTGSQMIGWGGGCCDDNVADGEAYTPATNSWERLPSGPLAGRQVTSGAWTGNELVIVGGVADGKVSSDAAAYNPATRSWRVLPSMPEPRSGATAVWDGAEVLVIGGRNTEGVQADGFAYDPATNTWRTMPAMEFARTGHVAVWTGSQMLVWGGRSSEQEGASARPSHGEAYDPATDSWSPLPMSPLRGRVDATAVWTGTAMIVWGGSSISPDPEKQFADGAAYTPGER